ncbi:MAG TPA: hypothetical protein VFJ17_03690 [Mycobacteriales bacterium]|nr:hypothetical protein [Mycobacteriales bacterium]
MTRLVLHAGLPKTGTTAFQAFAWQNREVLAARGVAYCDGFLGRNHTELGVAFSHRITPLTRSYGVHDESDRKALQARLPEMLGDPHRASTVLASSEHLTNLVYRPESVEEAAEALHALFDSVVVALVLRRPDYWTPSMYTESVRAGGPRPFNAHFVDRHRRLVDHVALLQRWSSAFGRDNVVAVPFLERDKSDPTTIPLRLLAVTGIDLHATDTWAASPSVRYTSISAYAVELLRRLNAEHPDAPLRARKDRRRIIAMVRDEWPGPTQAVTPAAANRLAKHGWVRADVGGVASGDATLWQEWLAQPDAPTMPAPQVSDEDLQRVIEMIPRPPAPQSWASRAPARARRLARRLIRGATPS